MSRQIDLKGNLEEFTKLLENNLALIPREKLIVSEEYQEESKKINDKEIGMTEGEIINYKGLNLLVKFNGNIRKDFIEKEETSFLDRALDGTKQSFNEICAAELFKILNPNYPTPKFFLVESKVSQLNNLKRINIASEILFEDPSQVNLESNANDSYRLLQSQTEGSTILSDFFCNIVIMLLLSNYDLKMDNFIKYNFNDHIFLVPIDFGNARFEEKLFPDIISGVDAIRGLGINFNHRFSSKKLTIKFSDPECNGTKEFYRNKLKPIHFLSVIKNIKSNQKEIEEGLREVIFTYSFGAREEKEVYAEVIVTRVRNLLSLESFFIKLEENKEDFSELVLRNSFAQSEEFMQILENGNTTVCKKFYFSIQEMFGLINKKIENISLFLEEYEKQSFSEEKGQNWSQIVKEVKEFNIFVVDCKIKTKRLFNGLEENYFDSEYISGNGLDPNAWDRDKSNINKELDDLLRTLREPLIQENLYDIYYSLQKEDENIFMIDFDGENNSISSNRSLSAELEKEFDFNQFSFPTKTSNQSFSEGSWRSFRSLTNVEDESDGEDRESHESQFQSNISQTAVSDIENSVGKYSDSEKEWEPENSLEYQKRLMNLKESFLKKAEKIENNILVSITHFNSYDMLKEVNRQKNSLEESKSLNEELPTKIIEPYSTSHLQTQFGNKIESTQSIY